MNIKLMKEMYFRELEGKATQEGRLPVQVGLLTVIGGALLFALRNPVASGEILFVPFVVVVMGALLLFAISIVQIYRANVGHDYERLPRADTMYSYFLKLTEFYEKNTNAKGSAEEDFDDYLKRKMVEATSRNTDVNLLRSARNHTAVVLMAFAVAFSLASGAMALSRSTEGPKKSEMRIERVIVNDLSCEKEGSK